MYTFSHIWQKSHVYVKSVGIESIAIFHLEAVSVDQRIADVIWFPYFHVTYVTYVRYATYLR